MRFSIVIPTYERRKTVARTIAALDAQAHRDFEVIVVVDGSTDGTAQALRSLRVGFPLKVIEQENRGAGCARNTGIAAAGGEIVVFLDDDMRADPQMLAEHERSHRDGAQLVIGDLPLDPASPPNVLSRGVARWAARRRERLAANPQEIPLADLLSGQLSIACELLHRIGGFDASLTRNGLYGGEDIDFGYRVLEAGCRAVFNPLAITHQYYDVDPAEYLRRAYQAGRSEHELIVKYPQRAAQLDGGPRLHGRGQRCLLGPLVLAPAALSAPLRAAAASLVRSGRGGSRLLAAFMALRAMEYRRGARDSQRARVRGRAVVLAYHAISDMGEEPRLARYGVTPARFAAQLDALRTHGWTFIDLERLLGALDGGQRLPRRSVLVTFDDAYEDLLSAGVPLLAARGIPAVAFVVSGRVGDTNEWDRAIRVRPAALLDAQGVRALLERGVEVGSHSRTHRGLTGLQAGELTGELDGSARELEALGIPRPRALSYPYGLHSDAVRAAAGRAGYRVAFTVRPGMVHADGDRLAVPRVEVLSGDRPRALLLKIAAARWPARVRAGILRAARVEV
jgi:peptidoglycan/xylan/chitin deacetylase (PgdA/CDA1 family)/GT2 family glycosyltransferase